MQKRSWTLSLSLKILQPRGRGLGNYWTSIEKKVENIMRGDGMRILVPCVTQGKYL